MPRPRRTYFLRVLGVCFALSLLAGLFVFVGRSRDERRGEQISEPDYRTGGAHAVVSASQTRASTPSPNIPENSFSASPAASRNSSLPSSSPASGSAVPSSQASGTSGRPAESLSDLLTPGADLSDPKERARVVEQMQAIELRKKEAAVRRAEKLGIPKRIQRPDGTIQELVDFEGGRPVYATTHNANAAISTGANLLQALPFQVDGSGFTVGVWDGGAVRATHREFGDRVTVKDGAVPVDHTTHVGGTIAALGSTASAKGMAPGARIDSYEWNSDKSEITARGASYPGEPNTIYVSNHSYGYLSGWNYTGNASPMWDWWGDGTTSTGADNDFGRYNSYARDSDSLAASLPYLLMVRSAGNDRTDNPASGQMVSLQASGTTAVAYNPAVHPLGDGVYKGGGYDTIGFDALSKNVLTVGAAADAVNGTTRDPRRASVNGFSSWGPTDDGRIKPDLVANGDNLYSTLAGSDTSYGSMSGTSMASPNATGSAQLLVSLFAKLFPAHAIRASTLKALLLHTADDCGVPGPDYQYGWGMMNVNAAADLLQAYRESPGGGKLHEDRLTTAKPSQTYSITWDGVSPIRATLSWTDPAGSTTSTADLRTARLVNNLDLQITGPTGSVHQAYVMPYVNDWTPAQLSAPATTGKNNTDNVEQVFIAAPPAAGIYTVSVTYAGTLTNSLQNYSLIISGGLDTGAAPAPTLTGITPASDASGAAVVTVAGANFQLGANVKLTRSGEADVQASGQEVVRDSIKCRISTGSMASGLWNVVVTNPDGQSAILPNAFSVIGALWKDSLENGASSWTHSATQGTSYWALTTAQSYSPSRSFYAPGPATRNLDDLYSPVIAIPANSSNLRLSFWHMYNLQNGRDGGVLEFSINGGTWFDVTDAASGVAFAAGGYNATLSGGGKPADRNPLAGRRAWSGAALNFTQVVIDLTDSAKYAGKNLRVRWRLATDAGVSSAGWYIDDLAISGAGGVANLPPSITSAATAAPLITTGTSVALSVEGSDDKGEANLTYTWTVTGAFSAPVDFSENGTNSAKSTTATFSQAGSYTFTVTLRDSENLAVTSSVDVDVEQAASAVSLTPATLSLSKGETHQFSATVLDQFGQAMIVPPAISWSASGGSIDANGLYTAGSVIGGPFAVTAATGTVSSTATVNVIGQQFAAWKAQYFTTEEIASGIAGDSVDPDHDGLGNLLEYAFGSNPRDAGSAGSIVTTVDGEYLTITFSRPKELPGVRYRPQVSSDLVNWTFIETLEVLLDGDPQTIRARDTVPVSERTSRFIRLQVERVE